MKANFFATALLFPLFACAAEAVSQAAIDAELKRREAAQKEALDKENQAPESFGVPDQEKARKTVEVVYNTWRLSIMQGSETSWRGSTSSSRQMKVRNLIVSQRGSFPRDFFRAAQSAPPLENFRYVGAITGCKGYTMAATYVGKLKLGDGPATENAYVLEFVFESGKWKLDQTRFFNLSKLPDVRKRLYSKDLSLLKEQDGFQPYGKIPATPPACQPPVLIGKVFVDCPGRTVEMTINGMSLHEFDDERRADIISGGLKRGANTITYTIKDREGLERPAFAIGLFVAPETPGNTGVCVFDHILDGKDAARGGSFTFSISNEQIASMNPRFQGKKPEPFHAAPLKPAPKLEKQ